MTARPSSPETLNAPKIIGTDLMNGSKRSLQVNVRLSPEDLKTMRQAAEHIWPGLPLSNSPLLLTLAHHKAKEILNGQSHSPKSRR
jgi:hypothetical protein